jgi:hypothetical protein
MKKKKRDFGARFWSGTRKHSAVGLLETFFQFYNLAVVKESLSTMVQYSVQKNTRICGHPEEIFHLHQSLRSLVLAACLIGKQAEKGMFRAAPETHPAMPTGSLSATEYRDPVRVFRKAFRACRPADFEYFLSAVVYFSLDHSRVEEEGKIVIPYLQLMKILDAAWLIVERTSTGK